MAPIYWIVVGLVAGFFTGKLVRFHTVNWHGAIDALIGIVCAVGGAAVIRGFGIAGDSADWKVIAVAAVSAIVGTFVINDLARTREEEVEEHVAEGHPEYRKLEHSWEERLMHVNGDPMEGKLDAATEDGHLRREQPTYRDGERIA